MKRIFQHFKGDGLKAQMLKGISGSVGTRLINLPLVLASGVMLARSMGPENYGVYSFVLSLIMLIGLPTQAGLPTLLVRETAKNQAGEKWALIKGLLKISNVFVFIYSILVVFAALSTIVFLWQGHDANIISVFMWALLLLPVTAFEGVRTGALRGLRKITSSQIPEQIIRPAVISFLAGVTIILGEDISAITAIKFNIISAFFAFLIGTYFLLKAIPKEVKIVQAEYAIRPWLKSLLPLSLFSGLNMLDSQSTILLLGVLGSAEEVGLFKVAATGASLVAFGLTAINLVLAPHVARLYYSGELEKLQKLITITTRVSVFVSLPSLFVFFFYGEQLIVFVFGVDFVASSTSLAILCVGQLINASCGSVSLVLNMTGNDKDTVFGALIALCVNVLLCLLLVPNFGIVGAAIGYVISLASWKIILAVVTKKKTGLNTFFFNF